MLINVRFKYSLSLLQNMLFPKEVAEELEDLMSELSQENRHLHKDLVNKAFDAAKKELEDVEQTDIDIFHLLKKAYHHGYLTKEQKKNVLKKVEELHRRLKKDQEKIIHLEDDYSGINLLVNLIEDFLEHEKNYLDYVPGAEKKEYVKLLDVLQSPEKKLIVNKAVLEVFGDQLRYDGKLIQGIMIKGFDVEIVGQHYSDKDAIQKVYNNKELSSEHDPYCYIAESGRLFGKSEHYIRKIMGAKHADSNITIKVIIPAHMCWIRVERGVPAKFAIETKKILVAPPKPQKGFRVETEGKVRWAA